MKYYSVNFPSNSEIYLNEFRGIIEFDILNPEKFVRTFIWEDFSIKELINGVKAQQEEGLIDDLFIYIVVIVVFVIVLQVMCLCYFCCKPLRLKIINKLKNIKNVFFFNGMIRSITVAYIQYCMTNGKQVKKILRGEDLTSSEVNSIIIMGLTVFLFPCISYYIAKKYRNRLEEPEIKARISNLTLDIHKYRHPYAIYYHSVFLFRRLSYILVPTLLVNYPCYQMQILTLVSLFYIINYTSVRPHEDPRRYKLEQFNECCILIQTYVVSLFLSAPDEF